MDVRAEILSVFEELKVSTAGVDDDTRLREDLELDSTELVEIGVAVERRLPLDVDTAVFPALITFGEMVAFIEEALTTV